MKRDFSINVNFCLFSSEAYEVACMGVTEADWTQLAHESLNALELEIATQAFQRIEDFKYLELMESISNQKMRLGSGSSHGSAKSVTDHNHNVFIGDILAWQGKFQEAARLYRKCSRSDKAVALFTDLRLFDQAQVFLYGNIIIFFNINFLTFYLKKKRNI